MDIESIARLVPDHSRCECGGGFSSHHSNGERCPNCVRCQLESYATSQRELRKGLEKLRELSEKATAGIWLSKVRESFCGIEGPSRDAQDPRIAYVYGQFADRTPEETTANAQFIVACVNYVRSAILEGKG